MPGRFIQAGVCRKPGTTVRIATGEDCSNIFKPKCPPKVPDATLRHTGETFYFFGGRRCYAAGNLEVIIVDSFRRIPMNTDLRAPALGLCLILSCAILPAGELDKKASGPIAIDRTGKAKESDEDVIFRELSAQLPSRGERAASARLELQYWRQNFFSPAVRKLVKSKDGKTVEIVLLEAPADSMPGEAFSMALLVVDKRVVDWASCWTYNRTANQELLLEDVDGDGFLDVAFRASAGAFGLVNKRHHGRTGDKRKWLYAYRITTKGFESIFPVLERDLTIVLSFDSSNQPVKLELRGLPQLLRERRLVECTLTATNLSKTGIPIQPGAWFTIETPKAGCFMTYETPDKSTVIKPGKSVSQTLRLFIEESEKESPEIRWKFVPAPSDPPTSPVR
jgi:hypothetical protein